MRFTSYRRRRVPSTRRRLGDLLADNKGMLIGLPIIGLCAASAIAVSMWGDHLRFVRAEDATTMCAVNQAVARTTIVAVDRTDALTFANAPKFQRMMIGLGAYAERGERLAIVPFADDTGAPLNPVFDVCTPGRGTDADTLTESRAILEAKFEERFATPLEAAIRDLTTAATAPRSPITRQIERLARDRTLTAPGAALRLIVVSDFLENTEENSVYARGGAFVLPPPRDRFLEGVRVQMVELGNSRDSRHQTEALRQQWIAWFQAAGATIEDEYLPPGEWQS